MSDETTDKLDGANTFEARGLVWFETLYARMQSVEKKIEADNYQIKPMWERALAEILEARRELRDVNKRLDRIEGIILQTRADTRDVEDRVAILEETLKR